MTDTATSTTTAAPRTGPVGVGLIGAGVISDQYLGNLTTFPDLEVLFVADLDLERAAAQAEKWGVPASGTVDELLARDDVEIVVNLTIPAAHVEVALAAVAAGKHVWGEKPYALDRESGSRLAEAARAAGVRVAVAPDTILGSGIQTGLRAVRRGRHRHAPQRASRSSRCPAPSRGTRARSSSSPTARARCSTSVRITSPPSSRSSARWPR